MGPIIYYLGLGLLALTGCLTTRNIEDPIDGGNKGNDVGPDGVPGEPPADAFSDGPRADGTPDGANVDVYVGPDGPPDAMPDGCPWITSFQDSDEDGYGNPDETTEGCVIPEGYVDNNQDCDDEAIGINPEAMELPDDTDNDCDGLTNDFWRMVTAGDNHSCGLTLDGHIRCWGLNDQGQAPEEVLPEEIFTQVSAGRSHSCGLLESGSIYCWGTLTLPSDLDEEIFNSVSCGMTSTCAIKSTDNTVVCWGGNEWGQSIVPPEIAGEAVSQVASATGHTCVLKTDETVFCWGFTAELEDLPEGILFNQISAGAQHNCGIVSLDNTAYCWGYEGETSGASTLPPDLLGTSFAQIRASQHYSCGLLTTGAVRCWGENNNGQSTPPAATFIEVGESKGVHSCGVTTENIIRCWGNNDYGQAPAIFSL